MVEEGQLEKTGGDEGENMEWEEDEKINWEEVMIATKPDEKEPMMIVRIKWMKRMRNSMS